MISIDELVQGERVRLVSFGKTNSYYRRKLLSLGLTCGTELSIIRIAPLGCPIQVDVRGTSLGLRKEEACDLCWERV
ncbi:MAG: FeoA family protein [Legionella sp.]